MFSGDAEELLLKIEILGDPFLGPKMGFPGNGAPT